MISAAPFRTYASCSATGLKMLSLIWFRSRTGSLRWTSSAAYDVRRSLPLPLRKQNATAFDSISALENDAHRFGVDAVLLLKDTLGKRFDGVGILHRHDGL